MKIKTLILTLLVILTPSAIAKTSSSSLGEIASTLSFGAGIMAHVMWAACIIVGIILLTAAFSQYQIHRYNPKFVPLGVPITYLILGLIAITIPFIDYLTGIEKDITPTKQKKSPPTYYYDVD